MVNENMYEAKELRFKGSLNEYYEQYSLRIKVTLKSRQLKIALTNEDVQGKVDRQTKAIVIAAFGDNPLRAIQDCQSIEMAWEKLWTRYACETMINEPWILSDLVKLEPCRGKSTGDHISALQAQFSRLECMGSNVPASMKLALLISFLSILPQYVPMIASASTLQKELTEWNHFLCSSLKGAID